MAFWEVKNLKMEITLAMKWTVESDIHHSNGTRLV